MILGLFLCAHAAAVDGDTLRCRLPQLAAVHGRVRLAAIDAPELPGHCRRGRACAPGDGKAARDVLGWLVGGETVACRQTDARPDRPGFQDADPWGRPVARCTLVPVTGGTLDLSDEMLRLGLAKVWP